MFVFQFHLDSEEGQTFGELALIHPDCVRTASIVADERTDLVVISRDLYNRSVSKVVSREYEEKMKFIESLALFQVSTMHELSTHRGFQAYENCQCD